MVETEFTFLEVEPQRAAAQSPELRQTHLGDAPEVLNAIDVRLALHKLVAAMIHPVMLLVAQIYQAAVALPAIRINHAAKRHLALQNGRQHSAGTVRDDLRVNLPLPLEQPEDGNLFKSSPPALAAHPAPAKETFINLHLPPQRRFRFAQQSNALPNVAQVKVDRVAVQAGELGDFSGFHIQTKQPHQQPKFGRRNARTPKIYFSPRHHWLYTMFAWA